MCYWNGPATHFVEKASLTLITVKIIGEKSNPVYSNCIGQNSGESMALENTWFLATEDKLYCTVCAAPLCTGTKFLFSRACRTVRLLPSRACKTDKGRRSAHIQVKKELTLPCATTLQAYAGSNKIALSGIVSWLATGPLPGSFRVTCGRIQNFFVLINSEGNSSRNTGQGIQRCPRQPTKAAERMSLLGMPTPPYSRFAQAATT